MIKPHLLARSSSDSPLDPEQRTADFVADGDVALLMVVCGYHRRGSSMMMATAGSTEQTTPTTRVCRVCSVCGAGVTGGCQGGCTTARAEKAASCVMGAGGCCGGGSAGEAMHFGGS